MPFNKNAKLKFEIRNTNFKTFNMKCNQEGAPLSTPIPEGKVVHPYCTLYTRATDMCGNSGMPCAIPHGTTAPMMAEFLARLA